MQNKPENTKMIFADNLRFFLKINDKKQIDLARYLQSIGYKCSTGLVSAWCNGLKMPRINTINEICIWFHIEMSDLLTDKTDQKGGYEARKAERITQTILENDDLRELFSICEKMPPEKLKSLLKFVRPDA